MQHVAYLFGGENMSGRLRTRNIHFMVNEYEHDLIMQHVKESGSGTIREYMLDMASKGCVVNVNFDELREANYELKKIGTNINQIAHKVNAADAVTVSDVRKLQEDWKSVMRIISMKFLRFT